MSSHTNGTNRSRTAPRRFTAAAALTAAVVMMNTVGAGAALAAGPYIGSNSGGAWLRNAAYLGDQYKVRYVGNNTAVTMVCWTDTQWVYPPNSDYASNRWFKVDVPSVGVYKAYVHSSLVEGQVGVGAC
ncbi:MAG TPA: hypothetical protein VN408_19535 [Actinoplanes sp.]|nr:hypothetical protein [Actinoplanes sp.]